MAWGSYGDGSSNWPKFEDLCETVIGSIVLFKKRCLLFLVTDGFFLEDEFRGDESKAFSTVLTEAALLFRCPFYTSLTAVPNALFPVFFLAVTYCPPCLMPLVFC